MKTRYTLTNGIALNVIDTDRFKGALLSVNLIVPIKAETAAKNSLLLRVLKQGSANYPTLAAIHTRLDDLYAAELSSSSYKRGEMQVLSLTVDMLDREYIPDDTDVLGGAAEMLGEVLLHPLLDREGNFTTKIVAREKESLCDAIRAQINNKRQYASRRCIEEMCRNETFGLPLNGTVEEVETITPVALTERYHALLREARVELFFVGRCPAEMLLDRINAAFGAYPVGSPLAAPTQIVRRADQVREVTEVQKVAQGKLVLGFRSGFAVADPDYLNFMVFNEVYGGSPVSKLFVNVREKLSLCYYCSSSIDSYKGLMYVSSGVAVENRDKAFDEIMAQLDAVRRGDFSAEELANAIRSLQSTYCQLTDSHGAMVNYFLGRMLFGVDLTPEQMVAGFAQVTADGVVEAAKRVSLDTVYFLRGPDDKSTGEEDDDE